MRLRRFISVIAVAALLIAGRAQLSLAAAEVAASANVAVGPQYDSTHIYVAPGEGEAFVNSFTAVFGGKAEHHSATGE